MGLRCRMATRLSGPGRSCERSVALRRLELELAHTLGKTAATPRRDIAAVFDSISIPELIEQSDAIGFPIHMLALSLQVHTAPRLTRHRGAVSKTLLPSRSIVPG